MCSGLSSECIKRQNVLRFIITTCSGLSSECIKVNDKYYKIIINCFLFLLGLSSECVQAHCQCIKVYHHDVFRAVFTGPVDQYHTGTGASLLIFVTSFKTTKAFVLHTLILNEKEILK
ncbi:unnamed protein product [Rotaria magnacalcarata]